MSGMKRPSDFAEPSKIHPSRKRRVQYSDEDAQLAKLYELLADDVQAVRLKAAGELLQTLSSKVPDQVQRIDTALYRLIKGLCSGRKNARVGFSVALAETLRLAFQIAYDDIINEFKLEAVTHNVIRLTQPEGKASGQERRDHLLGRQFAFSAILKSDVGKIHSVTDREWRTLADALCELALQSQWLRSECGAILHDFILSSSDLLLPSRVEAVIASLHEKGLLKTPEGVALWLSVIKRFPDVRLPRGIWHKNDPLSTKERQPLKKLMHTGSAAVEDSVRRDRDDTSGGRRVQPGFAWQVILSHMGKRCERKQFRHFWSDVVDNSFFASSSSTERKAFGLEIVTLAVASAPSDMLSCVISKVVISYIISQRTDSSRYLFEAAKKPLNQMVDRAHVEPGTAPDVVSTLLTNGALNFDQLTKTKTVESILQHLDGEGLPRLFSLLGNMIANPGTEDQSQADSRRRTVTDMLLCIARSRREPSQSCQEDAAHLGAKRLQGWMLQLLDILLAHAYLHSEVAVQPPLSDTNRSVIKARLSTYLGSSMDYAPDVATLALEYITSWLVKSRKQLHGRLSEKAVQALTAGHDCRKDLSRKVNSSLSADSPALQAFLLLFSLAMLQVHDEESDSVEVLEDLTASYQVWRDGTESTAMLVELLLSFVSKPSAMFRKLAEKVFATFAADMTAESLQSLTDILQQRESMSGQQELFDQHDHVDSSARTEHDHFDVEDASDAELVAGEDFDEDEKSVSDDDDGVSSLEEVGAAEDEEAAFDRKLADALGTADTNGDTDDDGSDMDDEQMLALEPHLTSIFKEHKKKSNAKQDNEDAKQNIVNFKNRVLDLLSIYVKSQYANIVAIELILPLTQLIRTTTSKPTAEKAFSVLKQYFEACNKHKKLPKPDDVETCFEVLVALHIEMKVGSSKLHANACSRSSLFLAKIMVGLNVKNYTRIANMYANLQSEWFLNAESKVQGSIFTEWTSWSIAMRKQKWL